MSDMPELELDPVAEDIFDLMRRQPGDIFSPEALATELGYSEADITTSLLTLEQLELVERRELSGATAYILSSGAPEL